jgi:hypothetical protein
MIQRYSSLKLQPATDFVQDSQVSADVAASTIVNEKLTRFS